jgi:hypothetical protein
MVRPSIARWASIASSNVPRKQPVKGQRSIVRRVNYVKLIARLKMLAQGLTCNAVRTALVMSIVRINRAFVAAGWSSPAETMNALQRVAVRASQW